MPSAFIRLSVSMASQVRVAAGCETLTTETDCLAAKSNEAGSPCLWCCGEGCTGAGTAEWVKGGA